MADVMSQPPSDHLLRTLAAVPVSSNILEVGCGTGQHTEPLLRLGFPVHACDVDAEAVTATRERIVQHIDAETAEQCVQQVAPDGFGTYPDDAFHWIVAVDPTGYLRTPDDLPQWLREMRRLLIPGGWLYLATNSLTHLSTNGTTASQLTPEALDAAAEEAGLATASPAETAEEHGTSLVRAIFRHVTEATPR